MNIFICIVLASLLAFICSTASAIALGDASESAAPIGVIDRVSSVVYKFVEVNKTPTPSLPTEAVANLGGAEQRSFKSRIFRVDSRVLSSSLSNTLLANDSATFSVNTPTRAVNNALSFVGTVSENSLNTTSTKWLQVLSLVATRKANFEFAYSAPLSSYSRLESNIDCRLLNTGVSKLVVVARLQYRIDF